MTDLWPWLSLAVLGLYHGVNPAMGWLFAVALGLQERSRAAVLQALVPIALGHEASIAVVIVLVGAARLVVDPRWVHVAGAVALCAFGAFKLLRPRSHPRWVGMRISQPELALWSFLMSSAHGAGLMLLPILLQLPAVDHDHGLPGVEASSGPAALAIGAGLVHTLAMLLAMGAVALLVFEKLGVGVLRRAWVNLDAVWATAIIAGGLVTLIT